MGYVEPRTARHRIEMVEGAEHLWIPFRRQVFVMLFVPVWLIFWTVGGVMAFSQLIATGDVFLALWLIGWAIGWVFAASMLISQVGGERIRVVNGDLEVRRGWRRLGRTWRYRGTAIRNLVGWDGSFDWFGGFRAPMPFFMRPRTGAVKFDYGADSVYLGEGIDAPEGRQVADWLVRRLPRSAGDIA